jgi:hypothetical protein
MTARRIVVLARPGLGRRVEAILRSDGHEVYRTPDDGNLGALVSRLRPQLIIVALDIPWAGFQGSTQLLIEQMRPVPVLLLGEVEGDTQLDGIPRLPLAFDPWLLQAKVRGLLTTFESQGDG